MTITRSIGAPVTRVPPGGDGAEAQADSNAAATHGDLMLFLTS
jgi:hypothetical protein